MQINVSVVLRMIQKNVTLLFFNKSQKFSIRISHNVHIFWQPAWQTVLILFLNFGYITFFLMKPGNFGTACLECSYFWHSKPRFVLIWFLNFGKRQPHCSYWVVLFLLKKRNRNITCTTVFWCILTQWYQTKMAPK